MKKFIATVTAAVTALILICTCSATVLAAEEKFNTAGELYQYWAANNAYPDYVCGVWSTDGGIINLTVAVQNTDEGNKGKQEILDLIIDDSTVTFEYGENSYNRLREVYDELSPYLEKNIGLGWTCLSIDVMSGKVDVGIFEERKDDPDTVKMIEEIKSMYGDMIEIEYTGQAVYTALIDEGIGQNAMPQPQSEAFDYLPFAVFGIILLAFTSMFILFIFRKKRTAMLKTGTDGTVTLCAPLTAKETENAVRKSAVDLPVGLDEKVFNRIKQ